MTKQHIWVFYSTFATRAEALSAAHALLEQRLIACANIHENITSVYRWHDQIKQEQEVILVAKTRKARLQKAMDTLKTIHPYELPCIVAYPITQGFPPFLQWVEDETA